MQFANFLHMENIIIYSVWFFSFEFCLLTTRHTAATVGELNFLSQSRPHQLHRIAYHWWDWESWNAMMSGHR